MAKASSNSQENGVAVINRDSQDVEPWDQHTPYVALSYVWGAVESASSPVQPPPQRKKLPRNLSLIIRDARR